MNGQITVATPGETRAEREANAQSLRFTKFSMILDDNGGSSSSATSEGENEDDRPSVVADHEEHASSVVVVAEEDEEDISPLHSLAMVSFNIIRYEAIL